MSVDMNITVDKNTTYSQDILWETSAGAPVDLTNYHAYMQVRTSSGNVLILDLSDTTYGLIINVGLSKITISLTPTETASLNAGIYIYDLLTLAPDGTKTKIIGGQFILKNTVTEI